MDVSVILPVVNETYSLRQTVEIINKTSSEYIREYIIVVCKFTREESIEVIENLKIDYPGLIFVHQQKLPYLGGAIREAFELAQGSHLILMASDLETDPWIVQNLIQEESRFEHGIVTTSRWISGGSFKGYSKVKYLFNWLFQKLISTLYWSDLTDMTYAYRIMPRALVQKIKWEELRHPFLLETLIKPLMLKTPIKEIPANWSARTEGESQNTFLRTFSYIKIALKVRLYKFKDLIKEV